MAEEVRQRRDAGRPLLPLVVPGRSNLIIRCGLAGQRLDKAGPNCDQAGVGQQAVEIGRVE